MSYLSLMGMILLITGIILIKRDPFGDERPAAGESEVKPSAGPYVLGAIGALIVGGTLISSLDQDTINLLIVKLSGLVR